MAWRCEVAPVSRGGHGEKSWVRFAPARENVALCGAVWRGQSETEWHLALFCRNVDFPTNGVRASGELGHACVTDGTASCCIETPFVFVLGFYTGRMKNGRKIGGIS